MLVPVPDCQLLTPELMAGFPAAEALTRHLCSRSDEIEITLTQSEGGLDVHLVHDRPLTASLRIELAQMAQDHRLARLTFGTEPIVTMTPPSQRFGRAHVVPPPGAFLQATQHGEQTLVQAVLKMISGAGRVIDLFSGCGTFSLPIAERSEVHAVEGEGPMLEALDKGWRATADLRRVTTERRDLFRRPCLPDELRGYDAALLDPPRAGAQAQVAELAVSKVPLIAMVSCNPVTFARDARDLIAAGYQMEPPLIVDQFRWSTHVEVASRFTLS